MERRPTSIRTTLALFVLALTLIAPWALGQNPVRVTETAAGILPAQYFSEDLLLLGEEVMRHVVDECDFYLQHQGNRIDFDPLEAGKMQLQIHLSRRAERIALRNRIREVVRFQPSFYKRSLMYHAYYRLCIQQIGVDEAERIVSQVMSTPNVPNSIAEADAVIQSLYHPQGYEPRHHAERARRDRAKIEVLEFIKADEADPIVRHKLESVIQEIVYDIELWERP